MGPAIGRSIGEGFHAANRSWMGMAIVGGCWGLVWVVLIGAIWLTVPWKELHQQSWEALRERARAETTEPPAAPPRPPAPQATPSPGAQATPRQDVTGQATAAPKNPPDLFTTLKSPAGVGTGAHTAGADTFAPPPQKPTSSDTAREERMRLLVGWLRRAWPVLLLCGVGLIIVSVWLYGAQVGYLAKMVSVRQATPSDLWTAGTSAFTSLLSASLLSLLLGGGLILVGILAVVLVALIAKMVPNWVTTLLALVFVLGVLGGLVWVSIRMIFWLVAIVVDGAGPLTGLKATFRATRGRWWQVFGLSALLGVILFGLEAPYRLLSALLAAQKATVVLLLMTGLYLLARLYLGFAVLAALVHFYEGAKSAAVAEGSKDAALTAPPPHPS